MSRFLLRPFRRFYRDDEAFHQLLLTVDEANRWQLGLDQALMSGLNSALYFGTSEAWTQLSDGNQP